MYLRALSKNCLDKTISEVNLILFSCWTPHSSNLLKFKCDYITVESKYFFCVLAVVSTRRWKMLPLPKQNAHSLPLNNCLRLLMTLFPCLLSASLTCFFSPSRQLLFCHELANGMWIVAEVRFDKTCKLLLWEHKLFDNELCTYLSKLCPCQSIVILHRQSSLYGCCCC
jgi:hypothetical protein